MAGDVPAERPEAQVLNLTGVVLALSGLALCAGSIHLVATVQHLDTTWTLPVFFAVSGVAQLYVAWAVYRRPDDRRMLLAAAAGSVVIALLWLLSRTVGLPFGPEKGRSAIGVSDTLASMEELLFAAIAICVVRAPQASERRLSWLSSPMGLRFTFMLLSALLFTAAVGGHKH